MHSNIIYKLFYNSKSPKTEWWNISMCLDKYCIYIYMFFGGFLLDKLDCDTFVPQRRWEGTQAAEMNDGQSPLYRVITISKRIEQGRQGREIEEWESREADGENDDLPRSRFMSEDHERRDMGRVAVIMGKGERNSVLTTAED